MNQCYIVVLFSLIITPFFLVSPTLAQDTIPCDQCGMSVDATGQARYKIVDANENLHTACCPICAFKMLKTYGQLNITSFCDYNGPNYQITINAKNYGSSLTLNPPTALVILGGGCAKNRLVYNGESADALLSSPNNGTSQWLFPLTNATVLANATRMGIAQAILQFGGGSTLACEQCGMDVDTAGQGRFKVFDSTGTLHIACCPVCALKMLKTYNQLVITSFCDWLGPKYPIIIQSKNYGSETTVTPPSALIIMGGSCAKNRIVYSAEAADALLSPPSNGTSPWLSSLTNATVASNATRLGITQAALQFGGGPPATPTPTPTQTTNPTQTTTPPPTPKPTPTSSPTPIPTAINESTLDCEACGMVVTTDDQYHFKVIDGTGKNLNVECFMCALNLIKWYDTLHIETFCDWYGPNCPITIDSTGFGNDITINPSTAIYLYAGECDSNRVAYNQTAADFLKEDYSEYTSLFQQNEWQETPKIITVAEAIVVYNKNSVQENISPIVVTMIITAVIGLTVAIGATTYWKSRQNRSGAH